MRTRSHLARTAPCSCRAPCFDVGPGSSSSMRLMEAAAIWRGHGERLRVETVHFGGLDERAWTARCAAASSEPAKVVRGERDGAWRSTTLCRFDASVIEIAGQPAQRDSATDRPAMVDLRRGGELGLEPRLHRFEDRLARACARPATIRSARIRARRREGRCARALGDRRGSRPGFSSPRRQQNASLAGLVGQRLVGA